VARVVPSALNATDVTPPPYPVNALPIWRWVARSHSRTVPSLLALARVLPSGLKATEWTVLVCPVKPAIPGCAAAASRAGIAMAAPIVIAAAAPIVRRRVRAGRFLIAGGRCAAKRSDIAGVPFFLASASGRG
jgi:hypothetical protein